MPRDDKTLRQPTPAQWKILRDIADGKIERHRREGANEGWDYRHAAATMEPSSVEVLNRLRYQRPSPIEYQVPAPDGSIPDPVFRLTRHGQALLDAGPRRT